MRSILGLLQFTYNLKSKYLDSQFKKKKSKYLISPNINLTILT